MICDTDDDDFKLTKEYKHLLSNIRPLIEQLDNSKGKQFLDFVFKRRTSHTICINVLCAKKLHTLK